MRPVEPYDVAIVLGAAIRPDGRPSPALERRVRHATDLARSGRVRNLLMSGGPVRHPMPEAWLMRDLAVADGVAATTIHMEEYARNTIENARLSAAIVQARGWRRVLVVTDRYHAARASYVFRRFGLRVAISAPNPPVRRGKEWWLAYLREASALPWTVLRVEGSVLLEN